MNDCCKISASSDDVKFLVFLLVIPAHPSLQWRVRCGKLEMRTAHRTDHSCCVQFSLGSRR